MPAVAKQRLALAESPFVGGFDLTGSVTLAEQLPVGTIGDGSVGSEIQGNLGGGYLDLMAAAEKPGRLFDLDEVSARRKLFLDGTKGLNSRFHDAVYLRLNPIPARSDLKQGETERVKVLVFIL